MLQAVQDLSSSPNVSTPTFEEIRRKAEMFGTRTVFGNYNFVSSVKNRSAGLTVYVGSEKVRQRSLKEAQKRILENLLETIEAVKKYIKKAPFIKVVRTMGQNDEFTPRCNYFVSTQRKEMVRLAYMVHQTLFNADTYVNGPELYIVHIPEWHEKDRQILVFPEIDVTFVLGSDYYGEAKKGFLRMAMWEAKQRGMLGLHAGSKIVKARDANNGKLKTYGMIIFGLTATGKTTHTCHTHNLDPNLNEEVGILQDDVIFLKKDGSALGPEKGFYLKTENLSPETQPIIWQAATKPDTIFENVMVDHQGNIHFDDPTLTGNGRGIMQRADLSPYIANDVNLPPLSLLDGLIIIFITRRNTIVPIASRLTPEQAAAAFMLGESIESSGSDPTRAGESVREVGTNPFIIGDPAEEGNWIYDFIKRHEDEIQCYMINTGGIGEISERINGRRVIKRKALRPEIPETATIIRNILRGSIEWEKEPIFGTYVAKKVNSLDISKFDIKRYYEESEIVKLANELKTERKEWFSKFPNLEPEVKRSLV